MNPAPSAIPLSFSHIPPGSAWWLYAVVIAALAIHIGGGSVAILSAYSAVSVRKGERLHRLFGKIFVFSMLAMAAMGTVLAIFIQQRGNIAGGVLAGYLVATAWQTVRRRDGRIGRFEKLAMLVPIALALLFFAWGFEAVRLGGKLEGYPSPLYFVVGTIASLFAVLDGRMLMRGGVSGVQRLRRHLWRMCVGLFFAAGSFFLGQQKVMPHFMHGSPVLWVLALAPLGFMIFWLIRIRRTPNPPASWPLEIEEPSFAQA